jgi:hypothetical protein
MSEVAAQHRFVTEYEAFVRDVLDPTAAEVSPVQMERSSLLVQVFD